MTIVKYHHHFVRCSKTFVNQTRVMDNSIDGLMSVRTLVENILQAAWSSRLLAGSSSLASVPGWMSHSIVGIWLWLSLVRDLYDNWSQQESPRLWPLIGQFSQAEPLIGCSVNLWPSWYFALWGGNQIGVDWFYWMMGPIMGQIFGPKSMLVISMTFFGKRLGNKIWNFR